MKAKLVAAIAMFWLAATAGAARAEDLYYDSSFGPMEIHFYDGGSLHGRYQRTGGGQRPGRLVGGVSAGGIVGGYWLQADSDHPCSHPRQGTKAWGHFTILNAWGTNPNAAPAPLGVWGYCDEIPNRSWDLQQRKPPNSR
ncbi:MAG: hypothetical protein JO305_11385 [Alphaproteobacteria bacterium]|nr:hypothetical protein [Alphaproteobacteria bacterium]